VRDLDLAHARVDLVVPNRKLRCATCQTIRTEGYSFLGSYRRYTERFERMVADYCRLLPIKQVAERFGLSWHAVKEIDKRRLEREVGTPCYDGLRLLGVDEVAVHKGPTYLTTVLDLETGRIVWVGKDRTEATLASFFAELTQEQRASIEAVACDMAAGFRNAVEKACPHAALVYDLFHVVAKYSREVVDVVRLEEAKKQDEGRAQADQGKPLPAPKERLEPTRVATAGPARAPRCQSDAEHRLRAEGPAQADLELYRPGAGAPWLSRAGSLPWQRSLGTCDDARTGS
jgi:transposase